MQNTIQSYGRVLIAGGSGFIGRHLSDWLQQNGAEVSIFSRTRPTLSSATWIEGNVLDLAALRRAMVCADAVVHLAAISHHRECASNPDLARMTNEQGTRTVLDAFESSDARRFIFASSGKVYGDRPPVPVPETHPADPKTLMARTKRVGEIALEELSNRRPDRCCITLRMFNAYGPGQGENFLVPKILKALSAGDVTIGDPAVVRDYVHVQDICEAIGVVLGCASSGYDLYNVGSGRGVAIGELIRTLGELYGRPYAVRRVETQIRMDEAEVEISDVNKLRRLGWVPKVELGQGLQELLRPGPVVATLG